MTAWGSQGPEPEESAPTAPENAAGPDGSLRGGTPANAVPTSGEPDRGRDTAASVPPGDRREQELMEDIERTREQIGDAVAALAEKTDVPARARGTAGQLSARLRSTAAHAQGRARAAASGVRDQLARTALTRRKAASSIPGKDRLRTRATAARATVPAPVQRVGAVVARRRVPVTAVAGGAGAAVLGYLAVRRWRR